MKDELRIVDCPEPEESILSALDAVAAELDLWICYFHLGRFHFSMGGGWSIAVSSESAGRFRIETCRLCRPTTSMFALAHDLARLAGLARRMSIDVRQAV
jgi:hypothetical protein